LHVSGHVSTRLVLDRRNMNSEADLRRSLTPKPLLYESCSRNWGGGAFDSLETAWHETYSEVEKSTVPTDGVKSKRPSNLPGPPAVATWQKNTGELGVVKNSATIEGD